MSFLCNNMAVIYVAVAVSLLGWLFGGTRSALVVQIVPWLMLFMAEILLCFPQKKPGETTYDARERVWRRMKRDPVVWMSVLFLVLLTIPFVNNGLCPVCDSEKIALGLSVGPYVKYLPFCVDRLEHLTVFLWFAVALSSLVVTRHCLARHGQRLLLEIVVWNGAALSVFGFIEAVAGAPGPFWQALHGSAVVPPGTFFSTFGYPNMAGDYFTTLFALGVAVWRWRYDEVREDIRRDHEHAQAKQRGKFWRQNYILIPTVLCFFAALNTLSRSAILMVTTLAVLFFVHTAVTFLNRLHRAKRVKAGAWGLLALIALVLTVVMFTPEKLQREVNTLDATGVLDRMAGKGQYHVDVAMRLWRDHLAFGCGGWGYRHLCLSKMTPEEQPYLQKVGGSNVHNDHLQFLAEHGLVGYGLLVAIVVFLLLPVAKVWRASVKAIRFSPDKAKRVPPPIQVFALPASVFCILGAALATTIHAFADCPLRSPAVLTLFFVMLAAMEGYLPEKTS